MVDVEKLKTNGVIVDPELKYQLDEGDLTPWTNGEGFYRNCVFDDETGEIRGITEVEDLIVEYCFPHNHHWNEACASLGYNNFEREMYSTDNLKSAARMIWLVESVKSGYRSKSLTRLLALLPAYFIDNGMKEVLNES